MTVASLASRHSPWRFLPLALIASLVVVAAVNGGMVYLAVHSFPGAVGGNAFDVSNGYDEILRNAERQARLGWSASLEAQGLRPALRLAGPDGAALAGARIVGAARRPVGPEQRAALAFSATADGAYIADAPLPAGGQWDVSLVVEQGGQQLRLTRRLALR